MHSPPHAEITEGISELECSDNVAVVDLPPVKLAFESGLQNADDLAVDIIDGCCKKKQPANNPSEIAHLFSVRRMAHPIVLMGTGHRWIRRVGQWMARFRGSVGKIVGH